MRSISKRALLLAALAGAALSSGELFAKERRNSNGNNGTTQFMANKSVMPMQVMKYNQTTTGNVTVRDHRVTKPLGSSSASGGVTVTASPRVRKTTKSGGLGVSIPGTNINVKPVTPKLPFSLPGSGNGSSSTTTSKVTTGGTVIRDHRKPVLSTPPLANGGGGVTVTQSPTNKPVSGRPKPFGIPPLTNGSGNGGVTVTGTPVVRDHRDKVTTGPLGLPLGGLGGKLGTSTGPVVRDHRDPVIPPLSGGNGGGGVTVTPTKPKGPFGNIGDVLGQNGGPVIRDHRDDKTPWNPTGPFTPPPLGTGGTGNPPSNPTGPFNPFPGGNPGPFNPFPGGKPPVADPGDPTTPPMDPGGPTQPPGGGGGGQPTPPPPADPVDPPCPPKNDNHCHDGFCWPNFGIGVGGFGGWGFGGGNFVTQPVYVTQPVVTSPVVVEQPAAEVATADASITVEPTDLTKVEAGATITINGKDFGNEAGRVGMALGEVLLAAKVVNWSDTAVTIMVPQMDLAVPGKAKFLVLRPDGSLATELSFILMPSTMK